MSKSKEKKDRRLHISTGRLVLIAALVTLVFTLFSATIAWGMYMDMQEQRSSTDVFRQLDCETLDGGRYTAEDLKGTRVTAFSVWETTCPPCLAEMPALEKLSHDYDPAEFRVIGVCFDTADKNGKVAKDRLATAQQQMKDAGTTFPHLIPDKAFATFGATDIPATPTTYFVDSKGEILAITTGSKDYQKWKAYVDDILEKSKG